MRIVKDGKHITSMKDWIECAEPNTNEHWRDGRSAKETARAWLGSGAALPSEIEALLANSRYLRVPLHWAAEPEPKLRFDKFPSESESSRLLVHASDFHGKYVIAVEAKADENFGETIAEALVHATERKLRNSGSNAILRVQQLCAPMCRTSNA